LFLLSSLFFIVFASLRAVPAKAQSGSIASGTRPNRYSGVAPNTAPTGKNSDDEDERKIHAFAKPYGLRANIWDR
jgi:hypothetical protein